MTYWWQRWDIKRKTQHSTESSKDATQHGDFERSNAARRLRKTQTHHAETLSKYITRGKQTTEGLLIEPEGESNASSASTVTQVGDSNVAFFTFLQHMQGREQGIERDRSLREEERERDRLRGERGTKCLRQFCPGLVEIDQARYQSLLHLARPSLMEEA